MNVYIEEEDLYQWCSTWVVENKTDFFCLSHKCSATSLGCHSVHLKVNSCKKNLYKCYSLLTDRWHVAEVVPKYTNICQLSVFNICKTAANVDTCDAYR